jgi:SAM-dependent methyltransferase
MPACAECRKMIKGNCQAYIEAQTILGRPLPPPPPGACMIPIAENYLKLIKKSMRVLEIGCGSWEVIKNHCNNVGAIYEGIDTKTEYFGKKTIATRLENLQELSFPDNYFDLVIGIQTMEHWPEQNCSLRRGLYQCFRVCKPYGKVLMNVPMHFHGAGLFVLGNSKRVEKIYQYFSSQLHIEKWGFPSDPVPPFIYSPSWIINKKAAYILDIQATKDKKLPSNCRNLIYQGRFEIIRLTQIYGLTYFIYRVLRKSRNLLNIK